MTIMHLKKKLSLARAENLKLLALVFVLTVCNWVGTAVSSGADSLVVINEFMASNNAGIRDSQGEYEDWIELYNLGEVPIRPAIQRPAS